MAQSKYQEKIDHLFNVAIHLDIESRNVFLTRECKDFPQIVRQEVEALLNADQAHASETKSFLKAAKVNLAEMLPSSVPAYEIIGRKIGNFEVKKKIATGGFGSVYLGLREDDYQQKVAIKVIRSEFGDNENFLRRFEIERQVLSDLNHPFIARLTDGGRIDDGRPYFVMEYVDGQMITDYCDSHQLDVDDRLKLFQKVCTAVAHAHQFGVVHRDIKPSNILVMNDGTPKLLDFGIAKLTDLRTQRRMVPLTETGQLPLTPEYASPEQLTGEPIGQTCDIYSLGIVLYELLTGSRPYKTKSDAHHELVKLVCEQDPNKPSTSISKIQATTLDSDQLRRKLIGDLDNIVLMALRREPARRYQSANHFSEDIQRYFDGLPVVARKDSVTYRTKKFLRRNRAAAIGASGVFVMLIATLISIWFGWRNAEISSAELRENLYASQMMYAYNEWNNGNLGIVNKILSDQYPQPEEPDLRSFDWDLLHALSQEEALSSIPVDIEMQYLTPMVKGKSVAGVIGNAIYSIDLRTQLRTKLSTQLNRIEGYELQWLVFDNMGKILVTNWQGVDGSSIAQVTEIETLQTYRINGDTRLRALCFSTDSSIIAGSYEDGIIQVWKTDTGELVRKIKLGFNNKIHSLSISPDRKLLAGIESGKQHVILWNIGPDSDGHAKPFIYAVDGNFYDGTSFSPDGKAIAVGGRNMNIISLEGDGHEIIAWPRELAEYVQSVDFSPDGKYLAYGTAMHNLGVRNVNSQELMLQNSHHRAIMHVGFTADGKSLMSLSEDEIKVSNLGRGNSPWSYSGKEAGWNDVAAVMDGHDSIALADGDTLVIWNLVTTLRTKLDQHTHQGPINDIAYSKKFNLLASTGGKDAKVKIFDASSNTLLHTLSISDATPEEDSSVLTSLDFSPTKKQLLVMSLGGYAGLWDIDEQKEIWRAPASMSRIASGFTSDGKMMITAGGPWGKSGVIRVWDFESLGSNPIQEFTTSNMITTLDISRDNILATGDLDGTISTFDLNTMQPISQLLGHLIVSSVAFHPDGKTLISGGWDRYIKIWDLPTASERGTIRDPIDIIYALRFVKGPKGKLGLFVSNLEDSRIHWLAERGTPEE